MTNRDAFLVMVAVSEGTKGIGNDGYNCLFDSTADHPLLFDSYVDHPRQKVFIPRLNIFTTAAGRYQVLAHWFDAYKHLLNLPDFSPASQDAIALQQIKDVGAMQDVYTGNLKDAIMKCSKIWASLPGNNYGQPETSTIKLVEAYQNAGGFLA